MTKIYLYSNSSIIFLYFFKLVYLCFFILFREEKFFEIKDVYLYFKS